MSILNIANLTKSYGAQTVLDGVDLQVERGKIYGLIGLNGAGKTTLMRIIAGISRANGGEVSLFGETGGRGMRKARRRCGFMIEEPIFYSNLSARQNLKSVCYLKGARASSVGGLLNTVGLADDRKRMQSYSTGMKQRYGIAAALVGDPELLILDEPTNGIDISGIHDFCEMIRSLNREQGKTIVISSHSLSILKNVTSDFIYLHNGKITTDSSSSPEEYFSRLTGSVVES